MVGWSNLVSMITVSLVSAFLAAYLTSYFREKADAKRAHLESLKRGCLTPILKELRNLRSYFTPDESYTFKVPPEWLDVKWCDYFSFSSRGADDVLFNDLRNHYPALFDKLRHIENHIVRKVYPKYIRIKCELVKKLYEHGAQNDVVLAGAFFTLVGVPREYWPNLYRKLEEKELLSEVARISDAVARGSRKLVGEYKSLRSEALGDIEDAIRMVREALQSQKLKGKCNFI